MADIGRVRDIMTKNVLTVNPQDSLAVVAQLFEKYDYDGLPVVGADHKLLGIISAYDMIVQSSGMHLPTVLNIMDRISVNAADKKDLEAHFQKLREITAKSVMNPEPLTVKQDLDLQEAAKLFAEHHRVNPLIVVDEQGLLVGVVSRYDIIRFFNERYFQQMIGEATPYGSQLRGFTKSKSELEIDSAVGGLSSEFLLVTKRRPMIWRLVAIAMFVGGLVAATALVIRIVSKQG